MVQQKPQYDATNIWSRWQEFQKYNTGYYITILLPIFQWTNLPWQILVLIPMDFEQPGFLCPTSRLAWYKRANTQEIPQELIYWTWDPNYPNHCSLKGATSHISSLQVTIHRSKSNTRYKKIYKNSNYHPKGGNPHCGLITPYGNMDLGQHWFR